MPMGLFRANLKNVTVQIPSVTENSTKKPEIIEISGFLWRRTW
jgi:hypothetical protein